jgi:hypothetical protein
VKKGKKQNPGQSPGQMSIMSLQKEVVNKEQRETEKEYSY